MALTDREAAELDDLLRVELRHRCAGNLATYAGEVLQVTPARHHILLCDALEQIERRELDLLVVSMPPGSAKSSYGSIAFPAWYLGRHPEHRIIAASHTAELAERFGRRVRNIVAGEEHKLIFPGCIMSPDSQAAGRWDTTIDGGYYAAGIGGAITGMRADIACIDDPVKSREDADSETIREKQWAWWRDDLLTRLKPNAGVILIGCLTGDTEVMLSDYRSVKPIRDIKRGDVVASYEDGVLVNVVVQNWINHGPDLVYEIRMASGTSVRANARHPFLVHDDKGPTWTRLRNLRPGQEIFRVNGVSGRGRRAAMRAAISQSSVAGTVHRTTTRFDGRKVLGLLHAIKNLVVKRISNIATGLGIKSIQPYSKSKKGYVQYAESLQIKQPGIVTVKNSSSITVMKPEQLEGFFAMNATCLSGMQRKQELLSLPPHTSDFTTDRIIEIVEVGYEDVFDIQVSGTENFIANGLVSHNTRWHEDDLIGRVLSDAKQSQSRVRVIKLPMEAVAGDELGRLPGELLWPEWFTDAMVEQAKREPRTWTALYQQEPRPIGGGEFRREWLCQYRRPPAASNRVLLVDPASGKYRNRGDYTSMWVVGIGPDGNEYILDGVRDRLNLTGRAEKVFDLVRRWKPAVVGYEEYGLQADIEHIKIEQERQQYRFRVIPLGGGTKKEDRIRRLIPGLQQGRVWLPESMVRQCADGHQRDIILDLISEMESFPVGAHDDAIDCLARKEEPEIRRFLTQPSQDAATSLMLSRSPPKFSTYDTATGY